MNWALQLNNSQSGKLVQQSLGETLQSGFFPCQPNSPKPIEDRTGQPVTQEIVGKLQEELCSSDRSGQPDREENKHVLQNHDRSGQPDGEERLHKVQEDCHLKNRDDADKFNLAMDDENIDFNISGIPDATVKRSQSINVHDLIQRIESQPQKEAIQNDLEQHQSFNPFSDESKVAIMAAWNTEICEIINVEPKWQCKVCLKHCSTGIIYCTCGQLVTDDSAENRKYISAVLDTFSIPNFYIRKHRPHGHRYGKAPGCKDYFTANQLAKKCRKKKYASIHDRFIRDKTFRKAMIEVGRTEKRSSRRWISLQVRITLTKPIRKRLTSTVAIGGFTQMWHTSIQHQQGTNLISKRRCRQCTASSKRRTKRNMPHGRTIPPLRLGNGMQAGGSLILRW